MPSKNGQNPIFPIDPKSLKGYKIISNLTIELKISIKFTLRFFELPNLGVSIYSQIELWIFKNHLWGLFSGFKTYKAFKTFLWIFATSPPPPQRNVSFTLSSKDVFRLLNVCNLRLSTTPSSYHPFWVRWEIYHLEKERSI